MRPGRAKRGRAGLIGAAEPYPWPGGTTRGRKPSEVATNRIELRAADRPGQRVPRAKQARELCAKLHPTYAFQHAGWTPRPGDELA